MTGRLVSKGRPQLLPYLAFASLGLIRGASFLFIKLGVQDMTPTVLVFVRSAAGGIALAGIMGVPGRKLFGGPLESRPGPFASMALSHSLLPRRPVARCGQRLS